VRTGNRRVSRQGLAIASLLGCALCIGLALGIADATLAVLVISAGSFCASLAGPCAYTITIDMGGKHIPTVFSLMNMSGNVGAFLFPLLVPWLLRLSGEDWNLVLIVFAGIYLAAAVFWLLLNPHGTIFDQTQGKKA
jgi:MFS family permease